MSLTTTAFGVPGPNRYRVYYIVKNSSDVDNTLVTHCNSLVVLMFWAPWNELSKVMRTPFRSIALANRHRAIFCLINVDNFKDLAERYAAEALPTFVLIKNNTVLGRVVGAKEEELRRTIASNV